MGGCVLGEWPRIEGGTGHRFLDKHQGQSSPELDLRQVLLELNRADPSLLRWLF